MDCGGNNQQTAHFLPESLRQREFVAGTDQCDIWEVDKDPRVLVEGHEVSGDALQACPVSLWQARICAMSGKWTRTHGSGDALLQLRPTTFAVGTYQCNIWGKDPRVLEVA
eukprot:1154331-Pelagomonas_calceolata.AAC.1